MLSRFIHMGDLHLGRPFIYHNQGDANGKNKRKEMWAALEHILAFANEMEVPLILVAGDLFDSSDALPMDIKRVAEAFDNLKRTCVVIITGNHDYHGKNSLYAKVTWPGNVYIFAEDVFRSIYIKELNTEIYGMSWIKNQYRKFPVESFKAIQLNPERYNIFMAHGEIANSSDLLPLDLGLLESKGFNTVALGHIHKPGITKTGVAYCGSPVPLSFGETGDHGFLLCQVMQNPVTGTFTTLSRFKVIPSRSYVTREVVVTPEDSYTNIVNKIIYCDTEPQRKKDYYRMRLTGSVDPSIELTWLEDDVEDSFYYVELDISGLEPDIDLGSLMEENAGSPVGSFLKALNDIEDPAVKKRALVYSFDAMIKEGII